MVGLDSSVPPPMQADTNNNLLRRVNLTSGLVTTLAGSSPGYADGVGAAANFNNPWSVAVDSAGTFAVVVSSTITCVRVRRYACDCVSSTYCLEQRPERGAPAPPLGCPLRLPTPHS